MFSDVRVLKNDASLAALLRKRLEILDATVREHTKDGEERGVRKWAPARERWRGSPGPGGRSPRMQHCGRFREPGRVQQKNGGSLGAGLQGQREADRLDGVLGHVEGIHTSVSGFGEKVVINT